MILSRRHFSQILLGVITASVVPPTLANLVEGQDWRSISPPQPSDTPNKIEVLEFFSYGCPHCSTLNPLIKSWEPRLAEDVVLRRVPVTFGRQAWANLARLYYALESTGDLSRLDQDVFDALHEQRAKLYTEPAIIEWLSGRDVDTKAFTDAFNSFDVQTKVGRSDYLVGRYQIDAVPTIAVAGRYVVLGNRAKGLPGLLEIADQLIEQVRNEAAAS
ncbi:thiol:disulfide interchange protein DsbA/DsbL [Thiocystis violacea]|uniref:thiol:disulfide interchange protein DsbA/DsbL n=1 Tax=Thiocystis violacea TaxID=13725 RepID=UPI001905C129|nr:thiol:disulfide interchange protein DsbA/DsbL [Thiocystis violacea]MBK1719702.1 twin-arginine translocation pathway signal protein [Thiocystis violacea]